MEGKKRSAEEEAERFAESMREMRRRGMLPKDASVATEGGCVFLTMDPGALLRPLVRAGKAGELGEAMRKGGWAEVERRGIVEWIDKQEEANLRVALFLKEVREHHTHVELHPALIQGYCASLIPFSDRNQAPRNCYQSAMCKQAVGIYMTNFARRMDTASHLLLSPQKPLVATRCETALRTADVPSGVNVVVAILCYSGFNQEDSVILNSAAVERGLFRSEIFRAYRDDEHGSGAADTEVFEHPVKAGCVGLRVCSYDHIGEDGTCRPGATLQAGDCLIGKSIAVTSVVESAMEARAVKKRDKSTYLRHAEAATVDAVMRGTAREGRRTVRVRTRAERVPSLGDKFSSRHGQKGICGMLLRQEEMPFTQDGIVPDLIVNPHAIPSRMTLGHLMETLLGKLCAVGGEGFGDGTPFREVGTDQVAEELHKRGFQRHGEERLYSGMTGELMEGRVYLGPTFYQRLKHMSFDKVHGRARGPVAILTRQPMEGRARDGGLRVGEMERDVLIAHGAARVIEDRLCAQADPFLAIVCNAKAGGCGLLAASLEGKDVFCKNCGTGEFCVEVRMPYPFKLCLQELMALSIAPRLEVDGTGAAFLAG